MAAASVCGYADTPSNPEAGLAPGYSDLAYPAPMPGTYTLPNMGRAADGAVMEENGRANRLHALFSGKIVLLSFIYATCDDVNGCPLSTAVLQRIKNKLKAQPELAKSVRLVTLSFNPQHDTPEVMKRYGESFQGAGVEWHFLTTRSEAEIQPILRDYQQPVQQEVDAQGRATGKISHILRVFLIDGEQAIRNIYTVSYLHADTLMADLQTLVSEAAPEPGKASVQISHETLPQAGDEKTGYASADYQTQSLALHERTGKAVDLLGIAQRGATGLPPLPVPKSNPLSRAKIALGRKLFYDRRLSLNNTFSCAMCHIPEQGFTSQEQATAIGIEGRTVQRNSPTLYNVAFQQKLFHDGRESTLENQVWGPLLAHNEMGNPSVGFVLDKIAGLPDYRGLFEGAFQRTVSMEALGQALASYERTLISGRSRFDRWYFKHESAAMDDRESQGFALFTGKAGCSSCHAIGKDAALFTDHLPYNTGIGYRESLTDTRSGQRVQLAPGVAVNLNGATIAQVSEPRRNDLGLYEISQNPADRWKYKTPTLRNVALTAPYMHNGSLATLQDVVEFYNKGGEPNENLDPRIKPLGLNAVEMDALVAFLQALTGDNIKILVGDAYAAPIGDSR